MDSVFPKIRYPAVKEDLPENTVFFLNENINGKRKKKKRQKKGKGGKKGNQPKKKKKICS